MAEQFDQPQTVFQPSASGGVLPLSDVFDKQASFLSGLASQQYGASQQMIGNATSAFNVALDAYSKYAEQKATEDAPAMIKFDGDGNVIAPSSFYPPGISTRAYAESYKSTALAIYRTSADSELTNASELYKTKYAGDPAGYAAAMQQKRDAMVANLDPTVAPWIDVRARQVQAQGTSQLAVQNQTVQNKITSQKADEQYAGILDDASRLSAFQAGLQQKQTPAQLNDLIVNSSALSQRWQDFTTLAKSAGYSQAWIDDQKNKLAQNVIIKAHSEVVKNSYGQFYNSDGTQNPGAIAGARENIRQGAKQFAQQFPGHEVEYSDAMNRALEFATGQSSLRAQQIQVDDKRNTLPQQRQMQSDAAEAQRLRTSGEPDALVRSQAITDKLEQQGRDYLKNTKLSDSVAMDLAQTAFQTGAISRSALTEGYTNRIVGLSSTVRDPTATPEQKATAYENVRSIRSNPEVYNQLNSGQRTYLQGTMDEYVKTNYGMQVQAFNAKILQGETSPQKIDEVRAQQVASNMIPPEQIMQTAAIDSAAKKAYRDKQTQSTLAGQLVENFAQGKTSTAEQIAAHKAEANWQPPGGAKSIDYSQPTHVAAVQEFVQKYGYLPDLAKSSLDSMTLSPDENAIAGQKAVLATVRQVERSQMEKVTGNKNSDPRVEEAIDGNVAASIGKNYTFLDNATKFGADSAFKVAMQVGPEPSKAGALGQTPDQTRQSISQSVGNLETLLQKNTLNPITQTMLDPMSLFRSDADATPEQKAVAAASGMASKGMLDMVRNVIPGMGQTGNYDRVELDPNLSKALVERATVHLATDGKAIHAGQGGTGSPENFVANTAFFTAARNGELGATVSSDGKTLRIGWKSLGAQVEQAIGVHMTPKMEQGYAAGLIEAENFRVNGTLEETDPTRTHVLPYQANNGQQRYLISVQDQNGNFSQRMDIAKDDPRIAVQAIATVNAATQAVIALSHAPGTPTPQMYGTAIGTIGAGPFGAAIALSENAGGIPIKYPVHGYVHIGSLIGNAIENMQIAVNRPGMTQAILGDRPMLTAAQNQARKNATADTLEMLQQLDSSLKKIPDAPSLQETLTHMMETHAPGVDSSALRQLIKDAGFYQPGRLKPVQTGPTRIGTESR